MRCGSLFSGAGGFDMGFERAGFRIAWQAEIEPHACAVLRHHWPNVPNLGDVSDVSGALLEPVDVVIGGFPCQDLSVAGKRAGLTGGARSSLFFQFMRIVEEMRGATDGRSPAFVVIENVPGLFSSNGGNDFAVLLARLGELGALDIAWRVLDARWFGVPQRRRRVFVVADFGAERAEAVLFEPEGVSGNLEASGEAGEGVAGTLGGGSDARGYRNDLDGSGAFVVVALTAKAAPSGDECQNLVLAHALSARPNPSHRADSDTDVTHTLRADGFDASEDGTGRGTPLVPVTAIQERAVSESPGSGPDGVGVRTDGLSYTLEARSVPQAVAFDTTQITSAANYSNPQPGDPCHPLAAGMHPAVAFEWQASAAQGMTPSEQAAALTKSKHPAVSGTAVRRLMPCECEALMGWPRDHTRYGVKPNGTRYELADGPRYRLCGNGVVTPVAEWIANRLASQSAPLREEEE